MCVCVCVIAWLFHKLKDKLRYIVTTYDTNTQGICPQ